MLIPVRTRILCNTVSSGLILINPSPSLMGGGMVQKVRSDTWKMAPANS